MESLLSILPFENSARGVSVAPSHRLKRGFDLPQSNHSLATTNLVYKSDLPTVAKIGGYLAGETDIKDKTQSKRPIVSLQRESTDVYDELWEFTTYGRGLQCYIQLPKTVLQSLFDDIFSYSTIEAVSNELTDDE